MNKDIKHLEEAYNSVLGGDKAPELLNEININKFKRKYIPTDELPETMSESRLDVWTGKCFVSLLGTAYRSKTPAMVYGDPGMGKSTFIKSFAKDVAQSRGRQFVVWNTCSKEKKLEVLNNAGKYFVLLDIRVAVMDPTDVQGIPDKIPDIEWVTTKKHDWIVFLSRPEADGILFLDEINQGNPAVLNAMMQVLLDRNFDGTPLSENIAIVAAGNLLGQGNLQPLKPNLMDRFGIAGVLVVKPSEWIEYAKNTHINPWIINFVESNPKRFFYQTPGDDKDWQDDTKFVTPRTLERLSELLEDVEKEYEAYEASGKEPALDYSEKIERIVRANCGTKWANDFMIFLDYTHVFDTEHVARDPKEFAEKHLTEEDKEEAEQGSKKKKSGVFQAGGRTLSQGKITAYITWLTQQLKGAFEKATEENDFKVDVKDSKVANAITSFWNSFEFLPDDWIRVMTESVIREMGGQVDFKAKVMIASQDLMKANPKVKELVDKGLARLNKLKIVI